MKQSLVQLPGIVGKKGVMSNGCWKKTREAFADRVYRSNLQYTKMQQLI